MRARLVLRRQRDEQGSIAVMVGFMAVLLLSVSALAVDLGIAYVQKQAIQKRADFAALAGAAGDNLPMTAAGSTCNYGKAGLPGDQAIIDTAAYLSDTPGGTTVLPGQLVDCHLWNGEAGYGTFESNSACVDGICLAADENQLSVISQPRNVQFGLARVIADVEQVNVQGQATVEIKTPLQKTLPLYAASPCDYGQQTLVQPTNGQSSDGITLANASDTNTHITVDSLTVTPASDTTPPTVQANSTTTTVTLTGTRLHKVIRVGFFRSDDPPPAPELLEKQSATNPNGFTATADGLSLSFTIPGTVTSVEDVWFVRVFGPDSGNASATNKWTPVTNPSNANKENNLVARPFTVGSATFSCAEGSSDGNFGTLDVFNESPDAPGGQNDNIAYNIANGLQYGLAPYPQAFWTPPDYQCVDGQDGVAKTWEPGQNNEGTNCVGTKTGLASDSAEEGFVTGAAPDDEALLKNPEPEEKCPFDVPAATDHLMVAPTGDTISDDWLTCYFLNDTATVAGVSNETYPYTEPVIDQSIYQSARFVSVPVLGSIPDEGSSDRFEIIGFRPGFISDQPGTATRLGGAPSAGNGLVWTANGHLLELKIVFLNPQALPNPPLDPEGGYIPYVGTGTKMPLLVD